MKRYYLTFTGGLGDILLGMYRGSYSALEDTSGAVDVFLASHNPHAGELFAHHPARERIELHDGPMTSEGLHQAALGIPPISGLPHLPPSNRAPSFFPSPEDLEVLAQIEAHPLFQGWEWVSVVAPAASDPERDIPRAVVEDLLQIALDAGKLPVLVGRTYSRFEGDAHREDFAEYSDETVVNCIDKLTVPGVCRLVQLAGSVAACHSAVSMLAWLERKKNLLLYPNSVAERHFKHDDTFSFGLHHPETTAVIFGAPDLPNLLRDFFKE